MPRRTTVPEKMVEYLKNIYPRPATLKELCSVIGISACVGSSWIKTLISTREIEVYGKDGRRNLYRYRPK